MLSGGLDSSIVAAVLSQYGLKFPCFTINYEGQKNPDVEHARALASHLGQEHVAPALTPDSLMGLIDSLIEAMDAPHDALRHLGLYSTYRQMKTRGLKVAIVGEGADEFNMGYYWNYFGFGDSGRHLESDHFRRVLQAKAQTVERKLAKDLLDQIDFKEIIDRQVDQYYEANKGLPPLDRMQRYYCRKFLKYRLDANDTCGMANSIEARTPFCDRRVAEYCLSIPHHDNLRGGTEKWALREAFSDLLPARIAARRKFAIPNCDRLSLVESLLDEVASRVEDANSQVWALIDREHARELVNHVRSQVESAFLSNENHGTLFGETSEPDSELSVKSLFGLVTLARWHTKYF